MWTREYAYHENVEAARSWFIFKTNIYAYTVTQIHKHSIIIIFVELMDSKVIVQDLLLNNDLKFQKERKLINFSQLFAKNSTFIYQIEICNDVCS